MQRKGRIEGLRPGRRLALAVIAAVLGPAALAGEASRLPAVAPPGPRAEAAATVPLDTLAAAVAAWVAQAMAAPLPAELPRIDFVEPQRMAALRYGAEAEAAAAALTVVALYDDAARTIHLPAGWTGATPAELSVLVHEMVHHLQNLSERRYACPAAREAEAFELQERWLAMSGRDITEEFELDRLTLFVLTRCGF